jgi:hypothetical protein
MSYPPIKITNRAERILFDSGYSCALLIRCQDLLMRGFFASAPSRRESKVLLGEIADFLTAQSQMSYDEHYAAGEEAARKLFDKKE